MDNRLIELISKEIRETKRMTLAIQKETEQLKIVADAAQKNADAAMRKAEAAWELVIITREESRRPLWKKWFGVSG